MITETIVTTMDAAGCSHFAPIGLISHQDKWIVSPFRPSTTLRNLSEKSRLIANFTDDARYFAGLLTGRRDWPTVESDPGYPPRLADALSHWELEVDAIEEDEIRPRYICRLHREAVHAPYRGYNRAYGAVIEAAVLFSRMHLLPASEIDAEYARLKVIVSKTAGPREFQAFGWLEESLAIRRANP